MKGLILDTSTQKALVGLAEGSSLIQAEEIEAVRNLSSGLFPAIKPLCKGIDYIAIGIGPGSYMGVRTGATVAKLLAFSRHILLIEFPSTLVSIPPDQVGSFLFVGDAKMGEEFLVSGRIQKGRVTSLSPPQIITAGEALKYQRSFQALIDSKTVNPHLDWALLEVIDSLSQNNTTTPYSLKLSYIR
jgi:tRNA threonylcarbamoyl adenosine modification protein YeaZ